MTPAQAVITELKKSADWEIYYFGRKYATEGEKTLSVESKIIPEMGVKFISITTGRLQRQFSRHTIPSLLRVPFGILQSFYWILKIRPEVICSFGGYVSVPAVISGWILRIPILTHEQTITFGLSSRINSRFVDKIAVSFPDSMTHFPKSKVVLTGNPIRKEVFSLSHELKITNHGLPIIYITGGNQGSRMINKVVTQILPKLLKKYVVIHQCGGADYEDLKFQTSSLKPEEKRNYFLYNYVGPDKIGDVLNQSDLIISRAGANTVCEVAALGKPTLFIPIPWTYQDEQTKNAKMLQKLGIAEILNQNDLSPENLLEKIFLMTENVNQYKKNRETARALIRLDAAERIVKLINDLAQTKKQIS